MNELKELEKRLGDIIKNTCNVKGCANCDLKWNGGCSAIDLQNRIAVIEIQSK